jgi:hypothetical protein
MNERIQKLAEGMFDVVIDDRGREDCSTDYAGIERFAMRIVEECIYKIETHGIPVGNSAAAELTVDALLEVSDEIKEHFGMSA